jgi:hypothetical protein
MRIEQISQRGKEYLKTAETLLRAAQTMTDRAIASQLKALADDYERRAEKASHVDTVKALARSAANAEEEWWHDGPSCERSEYGRDYSIYPKV